MRKEKTISLGIISLFLIEIMVFSPVSAQEDEIQVDPGITPDNQVLWGIDRAIERVTLAINLGDENKVNYGLQIAEERLAEIEQMQEENVSIDFINKAEKARKNALERANDRAGENEELQERIQNREEVHNRILERIKGNLPDDIRENFGEAPIPGFLR